MCRGAAITQEKGFEHTLARFESRLDVEAYLFIGGGEFCAESKKKAAGGFAAIQVPKDEVLKEIAQNIGQWGGLFHGMGAKRCALRFRAAECLNSQSAFVPEGVVKAGARDSEGAGEVVDTGGLQALRDKEAHGFRNGFFAVEF